MLLSCTEKKLVFSSASSFLRCVIAEDYVTVLESHTNHTRASIGILKIEFEQLARAHYSWKWGGKHFWRYNSVDDPIACRWQLCMSISSMLGAREKMKRKIRVNKKSTLCSRFNSRIEMLSSRFDALLNDFPAPLIHCSSIGGQLAAKWKRLFAPKFFDQIFANLSCSCVMKIQFLARKRGLSDSIISLNSLFSASVICVKEITRSSSRRCRAAR